MTPHRLYAIRLSLIVLTAIIAFGSFAIAASAAPTPGHPEFNPTTGNYVYVGETDGAPRWQPFVDRAVRHWAAKGLTCPTIQVRSGPDLDDFDSSGAAIGRGQSCRNTDHGAVWIDTAWMAQVNDYELCTLAMHEVGHAVGLEHDDPQHPEMAMTGPYSDAGDCDPFKFKLRPATAAKAPVTRSWRTRVQPKRCKRWQWRKHHRKVCRRGVLVLHRSATS